VVARKKRYCKSYVAGQDKSRDLLLCLDVHYRIVVTIRHLISRLKTRLHLAIPLLSGFKNAHVLFKTILLTSISLL
jgi:hypothetical protein